MPSLQSGTSPWTSTCRASATVSSTAKSGHGSPQDPQAAVRNPRSNRALWAVSTPPWAKRSQAGSTSAGGGAAATIELLIPVRASMSGGTGMAGSTSVENSPSTRPARIRTAPISVIRASSGDQPVVSTSTTTYSSRVRGVAGHGATACHTGGAGTPGVQAGPHEGAASRSVTSSTVGGTADTLLPGTPRARNVRGRT